jgi:DNA (cytosine-5)-methyltransferase 1
MLSNEFNLIQYYIMSNRIKVVELFAGVGGFKLGLEGWNGNSASSGYKEKLKTDFQVVWSNQWEPSTKRQHASEVYCNQFESVHHSNSDIETVPTSEIPDHDLLVGGFPCQDYSVATTLKNSKGLIGKKGVLWWSIERILREKLKSNPVKYLLLENVDRLLKSPASQRGRDFAVMLKSLEQLGYAVEWRVINAADYGMPQRRRRVFFIAFHESTPEYNKILQCIKSDDWVIEQGVLAAAFQCAPDLKNEKSSFYLEGDLVDLSDKFGLGQNVSQFRNAGVMIKGNVTTLKVLPVYEEDVKTLGQILETDGIEKEFYIDDSQIEIWKHHKDGKSITRVSSEGFEYKYSEGGMHFPDPLDRPSRTIITGEGGKTPSRFKHIIWDVKAGNYRRLTPIELERLNMFPDNFTKTGTNGEISSNKRAFFMGNALVVGVVEKIGLQLQLLINGNKTL